MRSRLQPSESVASLRARGGVEDTASSVPHSKISLHISCKHLPDKDVLSKSDPMCVLFMSSPTSTGGKWVELGRTEEVPNCLDPTFTTPLIVDYRFEETQNLRFLLVDIDDRTTTSLKNQEFLGEVSVPLARIITATNSTFTTQLTDQHHKPISATITIAAEELVESKTVIALRFGARNLPNRRLVPFRKSNPFLVISRAREDGSWVPVHQTEICHNNLNPNWNEIRISSTLLCNSDSARPLKLQCFHMSSSGSLLGEVNTTQADLLAGSQTPLQLKHPARPENDVGSIVLLKAEMFTIPSFLDYVRGGCALEFMVAIDFTQSNGIPSDPKSLHFSNSGRISDYEKAIWAVGKIIAEYDTDKVFPVVAFGAKFKDDHDNTVVSHCLSLTQNEEGAFGVEGIVDAYRQALQRVQLWGPTIFTQVVNWASNSAARQPVTNESQHYTILLILTDGVITDMESTVNAIIDASTKPMSIIIVGIGSADFDAMDALDSDDALLSNGSRTAERDIVQFVPFRDFVDKSEEALAVHTLEEIPGQLVSYMTQRGIMPMQRAAAPYAL